MTLQNHIKDELLKYPYLKDWEVGYELKQGKCTQTIIITVSTTGNRCYKRFKVELIISFFGEYPLSSTHETLIAQGLVAHLLVLYWDEQKKNLIYTIEQLDLHFRGQKNSILDWRVEVKK